jgi:hypothetical protein
VQTKDGEAVVVAVKRLRRVEGWDRRGLIMLGNERYSNSHGRVEKYYEGISRKWRFAMGTSMGCRLWYVVRSIEW